MLYHGCFMSWFFGYSLEKGLMCRHNCVFWKLLTLPCLIWLVMIIKVVSHDKVHYIACPVNNHGGKMSRRDWPIYTEQNYKRNTCFCLHFSWAELKDLRIVCWLDSMIIAQGCLRLATIIGLSTMDYLGKGEVLTNTDLDRFVNNIREK